LQQKNVTTNIDVSNDTTNGFSGNITMKTLNKKESTKEKLGVMALLPLWNQRLKVSPSEHTNNL
jgi:hypothetical protein